MAATFIVNGDAVTIRFEWVDIQLTKAQEIVGYAAYYDWLRGLGPTIPDPQNPGEVIPKPWADMTNQAYVNEQQDAARDTAQQYVDGEYDLG
jgi:hypothetical protein